MISVTQTTGKAPHPSTREGTSLVALIGIAVVLASVGIPLLILEYVPLQDYGEWIFQSHIFNRLIAGEPSDTFSIRTYPVPYALSQLALSALLIKFSPFATSKLFLAAYLALAGWAIWLVVRRNALSPKAVIYLAVAAVVGSCFWSGYMGYQLGLVIFCIYLGLTKDQRTHLGILVLFSVLLFFSHGLVFASFCVAAGAYSLACKKHRVFALAMVPTGLLTAVYLSSNKFVPVTNALELNGVVQFLMYKAYTITKLGAYQNLVVGQADDSTIASVIPTVGLAANVIFALLALAAVVLVLRRAIARPLQDGEPLAILLLFVGFLIMPTNAAGIANPGERLLYPMLILLAPALFARTPLSRRLANGMIASLAIGLCLTLLSVVSLPQKHEVARSGASAGAATPSGSGDRVLYGHKATLFDYKIRETQRAWYKNEIPSQGLDFGTALIAQERGPGAAAPPQE
ncbi:hypothetical protein WG922_07035 [Ramlibacter sp. AN1015]|uniref:hypothetical protein n=1 Tax=Ramlibacter sp. AN1015 TaxID=3133428 RepID=UPI0030BDD9E7